MTDAAERVFFEDANTRVTNSRLVAFGKTYAMATVSSVTAENHSRTTASARPGFEYPGPHPGGGCLYPEPSPRRPRPR
jgi:hypothetical protein